MVGHRASLAGSLFEGCKREKGITFHFSSTFTKVHTFSPKPSFEITPRNGTAFNVEADVLLAADGVKSLIRAQILKELNVHGDVVDTGQAAYRILLKRSQMENDPELLALIDGDNVTRWIGERRHIIAYPVSSKTVYNISTAHPDTNFAAAPSATYTTKGSKEDMLKTYETFCPKVQRMLNLVPDGEVCEWKLRVHSPLPTWIHGSVALVGDACHPTLPHLAQGAAQAIEDAAVIAVALAKCPDQSPESIHKSLLVYEKVRKEHAETLVEMAAASGRALHLGDGAAKAERDKQFAALKEKKGAVPDKWADADVQKQIYGFDCQKVTEESFDEIFKSL
jgi:salicylate hydroxylase